MNFQIPCPPLPIQQEVLAILNEMEAELKVMEQMAAKAEQRAKYILDGYMSNQSKVEPLTEPLAESLAESENTLVSSDTAVPVRKVLGKKK